MPVVLSEVGSITLRAEHDLLVSEAGQDAVAVGIVDGIAAFLADRSLAVRIGLADETVGAYPEAVPGDGPPFWPDAAPADAFRVRVTNTGTEPLPAGAELVSGWEATDGPYLARAPEALAPIGPALPALEPGESAVVTVELPLPTGGDRAVAWISLQVRRATASDWGSAPLQLSSEPR